MDDITYVGLDVEPGRKRAPHARESSRLPLYPAPATYLSRMAGSPLKRQRKLGVRREDGSSIAFPYMPRVADLPAGWRHFSVAQKIEHLIGLDRCYEILSWPPSELDPLCRSMQMQVMRILWRICIKTVLDGSLDRELARERNRAEVLEQLCRMFTAPAVN